MTSERAPDCARGERAWDADAERMDEESVHDHDGDGGPTAAEDNGSTTMFITA